jgi:hypothetical protein
MVIDEDFKSRSGVPLSPSEKHGYISSPKPLSTSSPTASKKPFDWDLDPLTSPRKLKPFELEGKINFTLEGSGGKGAAQQGAAGQGQGQGPRKFSWESLDEPEDGGLPKLSKLDPVVYPRVSRF